MKEFNLTFIGHAINLAADPPRARQNLVWLAMIVLALLTSPEDVSGSSAIWIVIAGVLGAISLTNIFHARKLEEPRRSLMHLSVTFGAGLAAVIISMIVRPISGFFLLLVLFLLAYTSEHRPFVTAAISVIAAPWWVWLAADAWRWQLLMLVPIVGIGLTAISHLLDTHAWPADEERILPARAHRAAAWMLIALSGVLIILIGMLGEMNRPLLALAGIILAAAIPLEAGIGADSSGSAKSGVQIVTAAYLIAIGCWLASIG